MPLKEVARISLPSHPEEGGFDHAAVHVASSRLYVAHPSNDCVEVVDLATRRFLHSLDSLKGVAGVWVSDERDFLFTSNRGEDTTSIFRLPDEKELFRLSTGTRPNGMAFDPVRQILLVAGVGDAQVGAPPTATLIDVSKTQELARFDLPGRTRWALYHRISDAFYINLADPPRIARITSGRFPTMDGFIEIPSAGPHGMEQDPDGKTIYCACDDRSLVTVDLETGNARVAAKLAGAPDVLWLSPHLGHLYVAIGDPGVVQVFQTKTCELLETVRTAEGAHTLTVDAAHDEVHVFLPEAHEDLVLRDSTSP